MQDGSNILFLCTGNSCRSQMAEGWGRALKGDKYSFYSAGIEKHGLNPFAVKAMQEVGVDITGQYSKTLGELADVRIDLVITVCGHADETCPVLPEATRKMHFGFDDPPKLARDAADEAEAFSHYQRVRDEIRQFIEQLESHIPV